MLYMYSRLLQFSYNDEIYKTTFSHWHLNAEMNYYYRFFKTFYDTLKRNWSPICKKKMYVCCKTLSALISVNLRLFLKCVFEKWKLFYYNLQRRFYRCKYACMISKTRTMLKVVNQSSVKMHKYSQTLVHIVSNDITSKNVWRSGTL